MYYIGKVKFESVKMWNDCCVNIDEWEVRRRNQETLDLIPQCVKVYSDGSMYLVEEPEEQELADILFKIVQIPGVYIDNQKKALLVRVFGVEMIDLF